MENNAARCGAAFRPQPGFSPAAAPEAVEKARRWASDVETEQTWRFQAPASNLGHLTLVYDREPGTTRIQGALELMALHLIMDPGGHSGDSP